MEVEMEQVSSLISKDSTIGYIIQNYPQVAEILQENGIQCLSCHIFPYETLEQGFRGHGKDIEEINNILDKINSMINKQSLSKNQEVNFTDKAVEKFIDIKTKEKKDLSFLRLKVIPGGCSGFKYDFSFDENKQDQDVIIEKENLKILVDKDTINFVKGAKIDYIESLQENGFKISNPNAQSTCGCGTSFG